MSVSRNRRTGGKFKGKQLTKRQVHQRMDRVTKVGLITEDKYKKVDGEMIIHEDGSKTLGEPTYELVSKGKEIKGKSQHGLDFVMAFVDRGIKLNSKEEK
jgi:hypothetical protein